MRDAAKETTTETLPIFPLPNVVLFPGVHVPLYIFEQRYRQMTATALEGSRRIGMVMVPPESVPDMAGDPVVFPLGCAGTITEAKRLPDGCYHILLLGIHRFRILAEPPRSEDQLYRTASVERLEDAFDPADRSRVAAMREKTIELFADLVRRTAPKHGDRVKASLFADVDDVTFVNTLCQILDLPPLEKHGLLQANDIPSRFEQLSALLRFRLGELDRGASAPGRTVH